jgi:hypothetical protein
VTRLGNLDLLYMLLPPIRQILISCRAVSPIRYLSSCSFNLLKAPGRYRLSTFHVANQISFFLLTCTGRFSVRSVRLLLVLGFCTISFSGMGL